MGVRVTGLKSAGLKPSWGGVEGRTLNQDPIT